MLIIPKKNNYTSSTTPQKTVMKKKLKLFISSVFIALACSVPQTVYGMESADDRRPHEHFCPITLEVMRDPVVASDGHSYEREAIQGYLNSATRPKSPLTGLPLSHKNLVDNQALKSMIMDWKPGIQGGLSALEGRSAAEIAQRVREEFNKTAALLDSARGQHIVAFLGNTGAGKSTLVNWLADKELKVSNDEEEYVLVNPADPTAMVIGKGGNSETLYPKFIDVSGLRFFDLPGFNDTDGSERNLINAAFIRKVLLDADSVRLVFVVGQDQFTADKSASVLQMFNCLQQLFVIESDISLVDNGVFVATKVTCAPQADMAESLLRRTDSKDKADLNRQLQSWSQNNRLCRMFHPLRDNSNQGIKQEILELIKGTEAVKIHGINVSALYPSDTKRDLERMFLSVLEEALARKLKDYPVTLSEYDQALGYYTSNNFWQEFSVNVCGEDGAVGLLKEFCSIPYTKALTGIEQGNGGKLKAHIQYLGNQRQERVRDIEKRTEQRTQEVISSLVPSKADDEFVTFDFAYHRDFHGQVCGSHTITQLATDPLEQEVVRSSYAGLISEHSHNQMMRWHKKFGGVEELKESQAMAQRNIEIFMGQLAELQREKQERESKKTVKRERKAMEERQAREAAERQRLRQEAEQWQREKQQKQIREKVALWGSSIDTTMQRIRDLQNYQLTFRELVKVLYTMEKFYDLESDSHPDYLEWREAEISRQPGFSGYTEYKDSMTKMITAIVKVTEFRDGHPYIRSFVPTALRLLKRDVAEKMKKYEQLRGTPHPRKDEFGRM